MAGLVLSGMAVALILWLLMVRQSTLQQIEMRQAYAALPHHQASQLTRETEDWQNLALWWQSEGVLPRLVGYYHSEASVAEVVGFYREQLLAAGWQEYKEQWSLYPAYRKGDMRLAVLINQAFVQDWLPAGDYEVHLWSNPWLENLLRRQPGG